MQATPAPLGEGQINDTYLVQMSSGRYVLQRINQRVFHDGLTLMRNIARVADHLHQKMPGWAPRLIEAADGERWLELEGEFWRLWSYVEGRSFSQAVDDAQAEAAGRALGKTRRCLQDLGGPRLNDVIPGFLQLNHYLTEFQPFRELEPEWTAFIDARRLLQNRFRQRTGYIHGDCKLDNLIFSNSGDVVAVLDLDTVMWGHWAWDFGDLVRSLLTENALVSRFQSVARGYLAEAAVPASTEDLVLAPRYVTLMLGVRFLTDHLRGDTYFKVSQRGENRHRALAQFRLLQALEAQEATLADCANSLVEALGPQHDLNGNDQGDQ